MASSSNSSDQRNHDQTREHRHRDTHDWDSPNYVASWAEGQDQKEADRQEAFSVMAKTIPYGNSDRIKILDLGAGYGALTQFLLLRFPNATAICQDGSQEMAKLGHERMKALKGRFEYVICNFARQGWSRYVQGPFEAVVSSIAIHNVNSPNIVRSIYEDAYTLVKPGGCFLNFDRPRPPFDDQMKLLKDAGFENVDIFWKGDNRAVFGGFRKREIK